MKINKIMILYVAILGFATFLKQYPTGSYHAKVIFPMMPEQNIQINVENKKNARIFLNGIVNLESEFAYGYSMNTKTWWSVFDEELERTIKKFKCKVKEFYYDETNDVAVVKIKFPVIGMREIKMHKK